MKIILSLILTATFALCASPDDFAGRWKANFVDAHPLRVMSDEISLDFNVSGERLTGIAHMGDGLGDVPISGRINGDIFTFTVAVRSQPTGEIARSTAYPHIAFAGKIDGNKMLITLRWDSGTNAGSGRTLKMQGTRVADSQ